MADLYASLGYDFDNAKLGDALYLSAGAERFLEKANTEIPTWMVNDLANGPIDITNYYKNPLESSLSNSLSISTSYFVIANTVDMWDAASGNTLVSTIASLVIEVPKMQSHTDNVSGVREMTSNTETIPSLDSALSIGDMNLRLLNQTNGVSNTSPLLGSMTSLFIQEDIDANNTSMVIDTQTVQDSISVVSDESGSYYTSNLTEEQVTTLLYRASGYQSLLQTRREHDWNFFSKSMAMAQGFIKLNRFLNMGNTQTNLVENYIGTDTLKANLANT